MKNSMLKVIAVAAFGLSSITANAAISVVYLGAQGDATGGGNYGGLGTLTEGFESYAVAATPASFMGDGYVQANSLADNYAQPPGSAKFFSLPRTTGPNATTPGSNFSTVWSVGASATKLGLYWGSPDFGSNRIEFLLNGVAVSSAFDFSLVPASYTVGPNGANSASQYIVLDSGTTFNQVRFSTSNIAFEFDNLAVNTVSAVPEPGEWAMMLGGLGVVSLIARRRRSSAAAKV